MSVRQSIAKILVLNGVVVIFGGFAAGFVLGAVATGDVQGSHADWTLAHMEGLLNGMFLWLIVGLLPVLTLTIQQLRVMAYCAIGMAYCNLVFGVMRGLTGAKGLSFEGGSDAVLTATAGTLGVPLAIMAMLLIAWGAYKNA